MRIWYAFRNSPVKPVSSTFTSFTLLISAPSFGVLDDAIEILVGAGAGGGGGGGVEVLGADGRENGEVVIGAMDGVVGAESGRGILAGIVRPRSKLIGGGAATGGAGAGG